MFRSKVSFYNVNFMELKRKQKEENMSQSSPGVPDGLAEGAPWKGMAGLSNAGGRAESGEAHEKKVGEKQRWSW